MAIGVGYKMNKTADFHKSLLGKETATQFTVLGRGTFPMDMLRYDGCYPKSEKDTVTMQSDGLRELMLHKTLNWGHPKVWVPTVGRWNSFGWAVVSDLPANAGWGSKALALTHNATLISRLKQSMYSAKQPRSFEERVAAQEWTALSDDPRGEFP